MSISKKNIRLIFCLSVPKILGQTLMGRGREHHKDSESYSDSWSEMLSYGAVVKIQFTRKKEHGQGEKICLLLLVLEKCPDNAGKYWRTCCTHRSCFWGSSGHSQDFLENIRSSMHRNWIFSKLNCWIIVNWNIQCKQPFMISWQWFKYKTYLIITNY